MISLSAPIRSRLDPCATCNIRTYQLKVIIVVTPTSCSITDTDEAPQPIAKQQAYLSPSPFLVVPSVTLSLPQSAHISLRFP
eukprot:763139-Hanusia_phi.AAC.7